VSGDDVVFGDDDGVLFVAAEHATRVLAAAEQIWQTEREQAHRSGPARRCASRQPSATISPGAPHSRRTPSGSISGGSAGPSRSNRGLQAGTGIEIAGDPRRRPLLPFLDRFPDSSNAAADWFQAHL
jgi:hypothetical protein